MQRQDAEKGYVSGCRNQGKMGSELRNGVAETPSKSREHCIKEEI